MPLILDPTGWTRPRLLKMLRYLRKALEETLENLESWPYAVRDAGSFRTARDLLTDAIALGDAREAGRWARQHLAKVVNVQYDALLAAIDLMKSHSEVPSPVPRKRN